jgi:hypothetical protein
MQGAAVRPLDDLVLEVDRQRRVGAAVRVVEELTLEKAASIDAYEQKLAERPWA